VIGDSGSWQLAPDVLSSVRARCTVGQVVRVMRHSEAGLIEVEGWIIGWLNTKGHPSARELAAAIKIQVFQSTVPSLRGKTILVNIGTPPDPRRN